MWGMSRNGNPAGMPHGKRRTGGQSDRLMLRGGALAWLGDAPHKTRRVILLTMPGCHKMPSAGSVMTNSPGRSSLHRLFFAAAAVLLLVSQPAFADKRVALVI